MIYRKYNESTNTAVLDIITKWKQDFSLLENHLGNLKEDTTISYTILL